MSSRLLQVFDRATVLPLRSTTPVVLFSDLHFGNGSRHDDFKRNAHILEGVIRDFYECNRYHVVLNGDIERGAALSTSCSRFPAEGTNLGVVGDGRGMQLNLCETTAPRPHPERDRLDATLAAIRERFGSDAIQRGLNLRVLD